MHLTFVGHSTLRVEVAGTVLLTDPILRAHVAFLTWEAPAPDVGLLSDVDAVLISHLHHDHCDPASLALLGRDRLLLVSSGSEAFFRRRRFTRVVGMRPGDVHVVKRVEVTATEAAHDGMRRPFGPTAIALGFVVAANGVCVYFAGDTDLFGGMRNLAPALDIALLPVSGWGSTLGPGHLDPVRAAEAAALIAPRLAIPIHWGALRPVWHRSRTSVQASEPARRFADEVRCRGGCAVAVLPPAGVVTCQKVTGSPCSSFWSSASACFDSDDLRTVPPY